MNHKKHHRIPEKIRVAILADFPLASLSAGALGRGAGQGSTWLPQLARAFENVPKLDIHWIILGRDGKPSESIEMHGQMFHRLKGTRFTVDVALNYWPARYAIQKKIRELAPDVVHAWGTERIYPAALRDCNCPTILSMQGILTAYEQIGGLENNWMWRRMVKSEPSMIRAATVVTAESQWGIDRVREIAPEVDCRMVEYGVHPDFFDLEWKPDPSKPYALYVGGANYRKGFDILLEALKRIPDRKWLIKMAGSGDIKGQCDKAGIENVECLGMIDWNEMRREMQGAWCAVLPTRGDTSPNTIKEARVVGMPVVASIHGGHTGYILDDVNGRIVDPLNADTLVSALDDVMSSLSRAKALGSAKLSEDRKYLDPKRTAKRFSSIYFEVAEYFSHH